MLSGLFAVGRAAPLGDETPICRVPPAVTATCPAATAESTGDDSEILRTSSLAVLEGLSWRHHPQILARRLSNLGPDILSEDAQPLGQVACPAPRQ
jgi:hypothetical protein